MFGAKLSISALVISAFLFVASFYLYMGASRETRPMRPIEITRAAKTRTNQRTPPPVSSSAVSSPVPSQTTVAPRQPPTSPTPAKPSLAEQLTQGRVDFARATADDLKRYVAESDLLLEANANDYSAYKAKLLSLLVLELKFNEPIPPEQYENVYSDLSTFSGANENDFLMQEIGSLNGTELSGFDTDLVHIPFLRYEALGDTDALGQLAQEYVANYPDSYLGYFYLAKAHWNSGNLGEALATIRNIFPSNLSDAEAFNIFEQMRRASAIDQITSMAVQ